MLDLKRGPGIPCPNCHVFMPIDLTVLLAGQPLVCNCCRTIISLDQSTSPQSMEIMRTVSANPTPYLKRK